MSVESRKPCLEKLTAVSVLASDSPLCVQHWRRTRVLKSKHTQTHRGLYTEHKHTCTLHIYTHARSMLVHTRTHTYMHTHAHARAHTHTDVTHECTHVADHTGMWRHIVTKPGHTEPSHLPLDSPPPPTPPQLLATPLSLCWKEGAVVWLDIYNSNGGHLYGSVSRQGGAHRALQIQSNPQIDT